MFVENNGYVIAPLTTRSVNINDTSLFPEALEGLMDFVNLIGLDTRESYLTLDSGFDSRANEDRILFHELVPIIKPNLRRTKNTEKIHARLDAFNETVYKERYRVERTFAWADSYRKLSQRYEILEATHLGFRYLAYALMNLKTFV